MLTRTHRFLPTSLTFFTGALSCVITVFTAVFSSVPSLLVCVVVETVMPPLGTVVPGVVPVVPVVVRFAPVLVPEVFAVTGVELPVGGVTFSVPVFVLAFGVAAAGVTAGAGNNRFQISPGKLTTYAKMK